MAHTLIYSPSRHCCNSGVCRPQYRGRPILAAMVPQLPCWFTLPAIRDENHERACVVQRCYRVNCYSGKYPANSVLSIYQAFPSSESNANPDSSPGYRLSGCRSNRHRSLDFLIALVAKQLAFIRVNDRVVPPSSREGASARVGAPAVATAASASRHHPP
jgi:hypothetical protein